jgi:hypothetical protein
VDNKSKRQGQITRVLPNCAPIQSYSTCGQRRVVPKRRRTNGFSVSRSHHQKQCHHSPANQCQRDDQKLCQTAQTRNVVFASLLPLRLSTIDRPTIPRRSFCGTISGCMNATNVRESGGLTADLDALFKLSVLMNLTRLLRFQLRSSVAWLPASPAFPVPEITANEHCGVCRTAPRTIGGRTLCQVVDGRTRPRRPSTGTLCGF